MFQGTGSGVGKSILTAGFCYLLQRKGYAVAPFKAQNMSLNSGVTLAGKEMGRAQILQAEACGIAPDVRMNPVLIKPERPGVSQLIRLGERVGSYSYQGYYELADENFEVVKQAFDSLASEFDCIVLEGAGSPAEINLQKTDIVNMRMAEYAKSRVFLIGDIHHGGVFAWLKGTYDLVQDHHRALIQGLVINKFLGDRKLLQPGIDQFQELVPVPTVGVLPYLKLELDEEDSQYISSFTPRPELFSIAVIRFPYISNFTDFQTLQKIDTLNIGFTQSIADLETADWIILPGSKNTLADLRFLRDSGLYDYLQSIVGKKWILGICGGFQILGNQIEDPDHLESDEQRAMGLGFLEMNTQMSSKKTLVNRRYEGANILAGLSIQGYEIHLGQSILQNTEVIQLCTQKNSSVLHVQNKLIGTYIHGFLDSPYILNQLWKAMEMSFSVDPTTLPSNAEQLSLLADTIEEFCDVEYMLSGHSKKIPMTDGIWTS